MNTPTSPEYAIFKDPLLRDVIALAMPALASAGDLLSLTNLELTACIHNIPHDFSIAWQKIMTTSSIGDFIFACARGYNLDPRSLLKVVDEITISANSFIDNHPEPKNRAYLEHILHHILDTVTPSGPFELDDAELARAEKHSPGLHIPDMDFESEAYYKWEEEMLDNNLRRTWEDRVDEARERSELARQRREPEREREIINRWRVIMGKAIEFATTGPATEFNFGRCRLQSY
jgi:hypothetical protein